MSKNYPKPLEVDGEIVQVIDERDNPDIGLAHVSCGSRINLSPFEAEELRDWLTKYLEEYYKRE